MCERTKQISSDTEAMVRMASPETMSQLQYALCPLYEQEQNGKPDRVKQAARFSQEMLVDVADGNTSSTIMHHPKDFDTLAHTLNTTLDRPLEIMAIACPSWVRGEENGQPSANPNLRRLGTGIHPTTQSLVNYMAVLSERADRIKRPVNIHVTYAGWEVTRTTDLPYNGGIASNQALDLIEQSREKLDTVLAPLNNKMFKTETSVYAPSDFHQIAEKTKQVLSKKKIRTVYQARRPYYPNGIDQAALDLAESTTMYNIANNQADVLIVPTSPAMARACMTGTDAAWIQLSPPTGY